MHMNRDKMHGSPPPSSLGASTIFVFCEIQYRRRRSQTRTRVLLYRIIVPSCLSQLIYLESTNLLLSLLASAALLSPMEGVATAFGNSPVSLDNSNIGHHFHSIFIGKCYHYLSQA
jgi:hypothetical protein